MDKFDNYFELLSFMGRNTATRSSIEHMQHGFFKDKLDAYINYGIIQFQPANDSRDDKFFLTQIGLSLWRNEMKIEDVIKEASK